MKSDNLQLNLPVSIDELALVYSLLQHVRLGSSGYDYSAYKLLERIDGKQKIGPEIFDSFESLCGYYKIRLPEISWDDEAIYAE